MSKIINILDLPSVYYPLDHTTHRLRSLRVLQATLAMNSLCQNEPWRLTSNVIGRGMEARRTSQIVFNFRRSMVPCCNWYFDGNIKRMKTFSRIRKLYWNWISNWMIPLAGPSLQHVTESDFTISFTFSDIFLNLWMDYNCPNHEHDDRKNPTKAITAALHWNAI